VHRAPGPRRLAAAGALLLALLPLGACRRFTPAEADREVYGILRARRCQVPALVGGLEVEAAQRVADAARARRTYRLGLREALALAAAASRDVLSQREDVYLAALDLTGARNAYHPLFGASGSAGVETSRDGSAVSGGAAGSITRAFETGGSIVLSVATDILRNLGHLDAVDLAQTILGADLSLPLARGSGWVAREALTQAERDTLYAMRDYARFQQTFTVDVATRFYRVLQLRDTQRNEEKTRENLRTLLARQEALGPQQAGRIPGFQLDQARQDLLRAEDRVQRARAAYEDALDRFKLQLGVPVGADLELDDSDLDTLRRRGPVPPPFSEADAPALAMRHRLDLMNVRDQEADALRRVLVAKDGLGPQVDLALSGSLKTPSKRPFDLRAVDPDALLGIDLGLPVERTAERNAWRAALIDASRARRLTQQREDEVVLAVREAFRNLAQARQSYDIQVQGVKLAEERAEGTGLSLEAGRDNVTIRDRLDAESALVEARNALTTALVDHAVARLELERDVGTLLVDAAGGWTPAPPLAKPGTPPAPDASPKQPGVAPAPGGE
jgi:outer membrane protein TolC